MSSFLSKAATSARVARALLKDGYLEDADSRAYYSAFNSAKALIAQANPGYETRTHGGVLGEFSRLFVKTGSLPKDFGQRINRAQSARLVADYEGEDIRPDEAANHVNFAEELLGRALALLPPDQHPRLPERTGPETLAETIAEEAAKKALAHVFCDLAEKKGEVVAPGLASELTLYGSEQELTDLVVNIGEMNDLNSYLKSRVTLPSLG